MEMSQVALPTAYSMHATIMYDRQLLSIQKVSFGAVQIQKLRRVALDEHLLVTLGLAVGDRVTVELDVESEAIVLRKVHAQKVRAVASSLSDDHAH
jgi:hypothetical protein